MSKPAKCMSLFLILVFIFCLCSCEINTLPAFDCKFGEEFALDGIMYKITGFQYDHEYDEGDLIGISATVVYSDTTAPVSFSFSNPSQTTSLLDMILIAGEQEYESDPSVSFSLSEDDTEFPGQVIFGFAIEKGAEITGAVVYKYRGEEKEEKATVDLADVSIAEADESELQWMSYHLEVAEKRFQNENDNTMAFKPVDGEQYVFVKLVVKDGDLIPYSEINMDTVSSVCLRTSYNEEFKPQNVILSVKDGVVINEETLSDASKLYEEQQEGFQLVYSVPENLALSDLRLCLIDK